MSAVDRENTAPRSGISNAEFRLKQTKPSTRPGHPNYRQAAIVTVAAHPRSRGTTSHEADFRRPRGGAFKPVSPGNYRPTLAARSPAATESGTPVRDRTDHRRPADLRLPGGSCIDQAAAKERPPSNPLSARQHRGWRWQELFMHQGS